MECEKGLRENIPLCAQTKEEKSNGMKKTMPLKKRTKKVSSFVLNDVHN